MAGLSLSNLPLLEQRIAAADPVCRSSTDRAVRSVSLRMEVAFNGCWMPPRLGLRKVLLVSGFRSIEEAQATRCWKDKETSDGGRWHEGRVVLYGTPSLSDPDTSQKGPISIRTGVENSTPLIPRNPTTTQHTSIRIPGEGHKRNGLSHGQNETWILRLQSTWTK